MKHGQIWVSAILYSALGIVIIGIILGIALPLVNNMRDRNTHIQTKEVMSTLNKNIMDVINEGPGSKRYLSPVTIEKGELDINTNSTPSVYWRFTTKNKLMEPGIIFNEGDLQIQLEEQATVGEYKLEIWVEYPNIRLELVPGLNSPFIGTYSMIIENSGYGEGSDKPTILIDIKTT